MELYEDLYSSIKRMLSLKKRRLGMSKVKMNRSDRDPETITTNSNYNNTKINIDEDFVRRLVNFLDKEMNKSFPDQTRLKTVLNIEVKKVVKTGNDKEVTKVIEKIRDIVFKERMKFIDNIEKKVAKILINKY